MGAQINTLGPAEPGRFKMNIGLDLPGVISPLQTVHRLRGGDSNEYQPPQSITSRSGGRGLQGITQGPKRPQNFDRFVMS